MTIHYLPLDLAKTPRENLFDMVKHANQTEPWIDLITPESFVILDVTPLANPYEITSEEGEIIEINTALRIRGQGLWRGVQTIEYSRINLADLQSVELVGDGENLSFITAAKIASVLGISTSVSAASNATVISSSTNYGFNEWDSRHIKNYLKLHQGLKYTQSNFAGNGKYKIVISPDTVLFDSSTVVTSLALYYGQLVFSFAKSV